MSELLRVGLTKAMHYERKRILAIFAHPDDETFLAGGTLAKYAAAGCEVFSVCATRGNADAEWRTTSQFAQRGMGETAKLRESALAEQTLRRKQD